MTTPASTTGGDGLPSLLVQAARTAAEADGLVAQDTKTTDTKKDTEKPPPDDNAAAAAALTKIGVSPEKKDAAASAMDMARSAIAATQQQTVQKAPSAGTAAHMMASQAAPQPPPPPVRKSPAPSQSMPSSSGSSKKKGPPLRRGKWTPEEEAYANRLIMEFKAGLLPLTDGTTLRTFLSKLLNCDPMRISKKFVGSNCIGKQVFRRRTADINRLTPEQIQQSRAELSELERRFLERVAQTNRVKSSGVGGGSGGGSSNVGGGGTVDGKLKDDIGDHAPPSPPWLQPPIGYKQGTGAAMAAAALAGGANSRAAAAGRALLQGVGGLDGGRSSKASLTSHGSAGLLAMAELQRRSQQNLLQNAIGNRSSANNLLAAAVAGSGSAGSGLSSSAMAQIARNASAARLAGLTAAGNSMNNLMLKTGLSRDQLTQLAREQGMASSASLSNMMERQSSFDALMSLDFQSLQSIDNLANLIQTGGGLPGKHIPDSGMKNWSADGGQGSATGSSGNLSGLASMRRLASAGRMESLLRSLSSGNVNKSAPASSAGGSGSNANFNNLLQSVQSNLGGAGSSANNLFGSNAASALSLANMFRPDSSTGLTALRMQDGLVQRNSSVDDFLSLVASGDIPHQDPTLLNVPLMQQQQQQAGAGGSQSGAQAAATYLAQQQLLAQAANSSNAALQNALGNLRSGSASSLGHQASASALQQRAAALGLASARNKRKLVDVEGDVDGQSPRKRAV